MSEGYPMHGPFHPACLVSTLNCTLYTAVSASLLFTVTMRLLHIKGEAWSSEPLDISLCFHSGSEKLRYMILSHRWREDEVLYADITHPDPSVARRRSGFSKLENSCRLALQIGYEYAWLDTCCIDKSSSAELSEAINSMYRYYAESTICFAYLDDVEGNFSTLEASSWFSRGWTLQELIAPKEMYFYDRNWKSIGTKKSLATRLHSASSIHVDVIRDPSAMAQFGISQKMQWASRRETTREEDETYSLLGIFGVNMPPLYGEGRKSAFRRLQIEIMKSSSDHTIFAWQRRTNVNDMLASSTRDFLTSLYWPTSFSDYLLTFPPSGEPKLDYALTNAGFHIELPIASIPQRKDLVLAFLACRNSDSSSMVAIVLQKQDLHGVWTSYQRVCVAQCSTFSIPPDTMKELQPKRQKIWIPQGEDKGQDLTVSDSLMYIRLRHIDLKMFHYQWVTSLGHDRDALRQIWEVGDYSTVRRALFPIVVHETEQRFSGPSVPISTFAIGEVNDILWVFIGIQVHRDKAELQPECFKYPAGYAWRHYRNCFRFFFENEYTAATDLARRSTSYFNAPDGTLTITLSDNWNRISVWIANKRYQRQE
ncbi:unnamed protein product [Periconia digitata]|uniref:Heterokaryon incompatibility domain-containing protein n=1 Tax=Periconia digitata TaxID=1303443 RepID=A0A9W4UIW6_9PLEO|nr:unnamed protein product [Periconia digitata]